MAQAARSFFDQRASQLFCFGAVGCGGEALCGLWSLFPASGFSAQVYGRGGKKRTFGAEQLRGFCQGWFPSHGVCGTCA